MVGVVHERSGEPRPVPLSLTQSALMEIRE